MRKNVKSVLKVILMGMLMAALAGCGKSDGQQESKGDGFVYVAEYAQMDMECDYIYGVTASGDELFLSGSSWEEETGEQSNYLYKYNMSDNKVENLPLEIADNSSIYGMAVDADGNLVMVASIYNYEEDEEGNVLNSESAIELWKVSSEDGSLIDKKDITDLMGDSEYAYVQYFCVDKDNNFYLSDGDNGIHVVNSDLQKICDISLENWIRNMVTSNEGDVYISTYGGSGLELRKVDLASKSLGEAVEGIASRYGDVEYFRGLSRSFLVRSSDQVSSFDLTSGEEEKLFKWLDVDVDSNNVAYAGELSDGRIWAVTRDYSRENTTYELIFLTRTEASKVKSKEEIVLGTVWLDSNIKSQIIKFNKTNPSYRITVKEYGGENYEEAYTQFNADLTTENCPDIISLSNIDFNLYVNKGVLEDLYPYLEKSGYKKEDYVENILEAYEVDGGLYGIFPQFYINTTLAKTSVVGDRSGWTLSEMLDFVEENNPEAIFSGGTRSSVFYYCIYNSIDEFIDWESGKCFFDGEDFIRTLEFAAKFPEEYDYSQEQEEGISARLRSNKLLLMQNSVSSVQEYQMMKGMFGEEITFIGYPNKESKGNLIQPTGGSMGLSAKSRNKDGAWEFMQTVLSAEYQDSLVTEHGGWGFPVRKSAIEKQFETDMTPDYYEDEEGNKVESPKTTWGWDDFEMEIMAATQEEVDTVKALIESAEKISGNSGGGTDEQLGSIITEEAEPFFKGQKSAADVAGIIQNRIQIYVNENR